ncbi:hypothetical protein [Nocardia salmonicida]|uniref:hypothetical protein n=1 Tax=Nocardia salmonicida TaxID=53431 RepID=UPI0007A41B97|nr:hypothetical protein [Nocardia salmonicida]MBC7299516.1 hypothetical protein [Nocardia sp.]
MLDELGRFWRGDDITIVLIGALFVGNLLLGTAWASARSRPFRSACAITGTTVLAWAAVTQPHGAVSIVLATACIVLFFAGIVTLANFDARRDGLEPLSWRGGFLRRLPRAPRRDRKQARRAHFIRTSRLATALGMEIALLRINAGLNRMTIADQLGIPGGRYGDIEEASQHDTCASIADLEAIAALHDTTITALYDAACARIARGDLPTGAERGARMFALALGTDIDRYFTDHASKP